MLADLFDPAFADSVARIAVPILLASLGGAICHRAGVFNIASRRFYFDGSFCCCSWNLYFRSRFLGCFICYNCWRLYGLMLFAEFHLRRPGDAIVVSIALNLIGLGLTTYLLRAVLGVSGVFQDEALGKIIEINIAFNREAYL